MSDSENFTEFSVSQKSVYNSQVFTDDVERSKSKCSILSTIDDFLGVPVEKLHDEDLKAIFINIYTLYFLKLFNFLILIEFWGDRVVQQRNRPRKSRNMYLFP